MKRTILTIVSSKKDELGNDIVETKFINLENVENILLTTSTVNTVKKDSKGYTWVEYSPYIDVKFYMASGKVMHFYDTESLKQINDFFRSDWK